MGPIDALWHLLNFLYPPLSLALLAAAAAKLLWRAELARVRWLTLTGWAAAAALAAAIGGWALLGRDGRIGTYAAMVACSAVALWWAGFVRAR